MSIRQYKTAIVVLVALVLFLAWRCFSLYSQMVNAAFISHQCENVGDYANAISNPASLGNDLNFLVGYCELNNKSLNPRIHRVVYRDYQRALTNVLAQLRVITTNDLGEDPRAWIEKYGK